jgi:hypothetical protein
MNKKKVASSPEKLTFQRDSYIRRQKEEGRNEDDENVAAMIDYYDNWLREAQSQVEDPAWQENNLEYDLRSTGSVTKPNYQLFMHKTYMPHCAIMILLIPIHLTF